MQEIYVEEKSEQLRIQGLKRSHSGELGSQRAPGSQRWLTSPQGSLGKAVGKAEPGH